MPTISSEGVIKPFHLFDRKCELIKPFQRVIFALKGIITPSAAASALSVRIPSDGGQSINM